MFWEEKIDLVAKTYDASDFKVPFNYWLEVLKKVEAKFIIDDLNYNFSFWASRIKHKNKIADTGRKHLMKYLEQLPDSDNYWLVLAFKENSKHYVYDCKVQPIQTLVSLSRCDFYVIDKKYSWFVYFNINHEADVVSVYKSGISATPFDVK